MAQDGDCQLRIAHIILRVADLRRAVAFYRDTLGLSLKFAFEGFAFFDAGAIVLALNEHKDAPGPGNRPLTEIVFDTPDVHAAYSALKARGVSFRVEPRVLTSDPTHDLVGTDFRDPDGHLVSITGRVPR